MDVIPVGSKVSVRANSPQGKAETYYGYVRKITIEHSIKYFVQFHPQDDFKQYTAADLHMEDDN